MRRRAVFRHAYRRQSDRRCRLCRHRQRRFDDHIGSPATASTGKISGCKYGFGTIWIGTWADRGWAVHRICLVAMVYVPANNCHYCIKDDKADMERDFGV